MTIRSIYAMMRMRCGLSHPQDSIWGQPRNGFPFRGRFMPLTGMRFYDKMIIAGAVCGCPPRAGVRD